MTMNLPPHCTALLSAKAESKLTFSEIAQKISKPEVWTTALFFGQAHADEATAKAIVNTLEIGSSVSYGPENKSMSVQMIEGGLSGKGGIDGMVSRGRTWEWPPKDPVIYRLYEVLVVYGWSYKALIHEKVRVQF